MSHFVAGLEADLGACNHVDITLTNGNNAIKSNERALYFNGIRLVLKQDNPQLLISRAISIK